MSEVAARGRVVVVTGASRGIGRGVAEHLLNRGYRVAGCARGETAWEAPEFTYYALDVTDELAVRATFSRIDEELGEIYGVAHLAGMGPIMNHSLLVPGTTLSKFLRQNVLGSFLVTREAAKLMRRHGTGRIVLTSSVAAALTLTGEAAYVASKAAVRNQTPSQAEHSTTLACGSDRIPSSPRQRGQALSSGNGVRACGEISTPQDLQCFESSSSRVKHTGQSVERARSISESSAPQ